MTGLGREAKKKGRARRPATRGAAPSRRAKRPAPAAPASEGVDVLSCVGGGPMERLVRRLAETGPARVVASYTPERWRERMAAGAAGRLVARLDANVLFPLRSVLGAIGGQERVLVATTNPFTLPLVLVATRRLHGKKVVALVYDLYPDALEAADVARADGLLARLAARANRYWFANADGLVFIGEGMSEHARRLYGEPRRHAVLETGADASEFDPAAIGPEAPESELERWCEGRIVCSYVGNLGRVHDWRTLAEALPRLAELGEGPRPLGVVVAASGAGVERLRASLPASVAGFVRFEPPLPDRAWARLLARSHLSLVTLGAKAGNTSIPSKTFSAMAAGNAVVAVAPAASDLARLVARHDAGVVVEPGDVDGLASALRTLVREPRTLEAVRGRARRAIAERYDMPVLASRWRELVASLPDRHPERGLYELAKRTLDVAGAAAGLALASPVLAAAAVAVAAELGRPVLFRQERPGKDGRSFELVKFRTMRSPRPGEEGPESDAARLGRVGRLLRATSVDELPTLWNVLVGDMSLVGPRPLLVRYLPRYSPRQARRHEVKPGITGWAQVNGRNALSWAEKFEHDVWYVENRSLRLDLEILLATVRKVLRREGISSDGHATMPEFQG